MPSPPCKKKRKKRRRRRERRRKRRKKEEEEKENEEEEEEQDVMVVGTELGSPQRTEPVLLTNELRSFPLLDQSGLELGDPSNF